MHELAVCQALIDEVVAIAAARRAVAVLDIHLRIGPLSGIEIPLLERAFPVAAAGTAAQDSVLHIRNAPVRVRCLECGEETAASASRLICGSCSGYRTRLSSGDELLLERVELRRAAEPLEEVH